ncbi:histone-lysine N-methyltransferase SETD1B-like [Anopheles funestus]|uniref:histone-lysine N-methyltransferase SETD1B-like n=1 Tax=Anopheles funestus TaxID=62324 RepID=UPI0020C66D9A|nr:histone-lysine N-methyltransferase SETD1B-like [Anopheles funestus]XP_049291000.1 histone-lysine N-methyltransferase SETD1B-like [Anopheles funestus]XP_049291002.1 histone-lysine N-methyltransferase SETD1B-like [Anopheles funestus]XP_049291003.1 histone-lysine N-methyltransferase SETD1B-like [Anopheles funestus]XP_049291004.1 histone-lysine N-methyltransferase SETD1B-like [Anopheles funestus]
MPAYAGFDSFASSRRTAESIYYTAKEYDSAEESDYVRRAIFEDGPNTMFNRRYVDPWDMENYVYIRKQVMDPTSESEVPPSPAGEPIQSKFYYVPGELNGNGLECRDCSSAELIDPEFETDAQEEDLERQSAVLLPEDELDGEPHHHPMEEHPSEMEEEEELNAEDDEDEDGFYTERYDTVMDEDSIGGDEHVYSSYTDLETSSTEQPSSCDSSMSALRLHTPGFGKTASNRRPIVLPKPLPQLEFPGPPSYEYYEPSCCYMPLPPPPPPPPPPAHFHHHHHHHQGHPGLPIGPPPSVTGTILSDHHNYYTLNDCLECARQEAEHVPLYATTSSGGLPVTTGSPTRRRSRSVSVVSQSMSLARRPSQMLDPATAIAIAATNANVCYTPQHFSLSKKGLLQIDYSCNWNNLDRYIAK